MRSWTRPRICRSDLCFCSPIWRKVWKAVINLSKFVGLNLVDNNYINQSLDALMSSKSSTIPFKFLSKIMKMTSSELTLSKN